METCILCKKQKETTSVSINISFQNCFWEGNAHCDEVWKHPFCKECLENFLQETLKEKLGSQNAFIDWEDMGRIKTFEEI